nr:hypothetical protein [Pandoravirus aubagnensis]
MAPFAKKKKKDYQENSRLTAVLWLANTANFLSFASFFLVYTNTQHIFKKKGDSFSMSIEPTTVAGDPWPAGISALPVEIRCRIVGFLPTADVAKARLAHRCLAVRESDRARALRHGATWLRTSPERACALGQTDVIAYLYRRKRIPHTINLTKAALLSGSMDMVRLVREKCVLWTDTSALIKSLDVPDLDLFYRLVDESANIRMDQVAECAVRAHRADVIDWLVKTNSHDWCTPAVFEQAVKSDNVAVMRFASATTDLYGNTRQCVFKRALFWESPQVARFLFHLGGVTVDSSVMTDASWHQSTARILLSIPGADIEEVMYMPHARLEVVRLLCDAYPQSSRQRILNSTNSVDVAQYVCEIDPRVDLQQGLDAAAHAGRLDVMRFLYTRGVSIDPAI